MRSSFLDRVLAASIPLTSLVVCWSTNAGAQTAGPVGAATEGPTELQEVVVTGIRYSLERAQDIKRDAPAVVEAITPADLGRFTDAGLADALQRVPGVQVDRNVSHVYSSGSGVTIRGLGADFVITTLNGRNVLGNPGFGGGGSRSLDYDSIAPEVISGLMVYKSPTASMVESGIAGEIDIQTLKPLDYKRGAGPYFGSASVQGSYQKDSGRVGPRFSGVIGGKFLDDTLGVYLAGVTSTEYQKTKQSFNYPGPVNISVQDSSGAVTPYNGILAISESDSLDESYRFVRRDLSGGLQWRPTDRLEFNVDGLYNRYSSYLNQSTYQNYTGYSLSGVTFAPGGALVRDGALLSYDTTKTVGGYPNSGGNGADVGGIINYVNDNYLIGTNAIYKGDDYRVTLDYAHNELKFSSDLRNGYWISSGAPADAINGIYDNSADAFSAHYYGANTPNNLNLYSTAADPSNQLGFYYEQNYYHSKRDQGRLDVQWDAKDWLSLKVGGRRENTVLTFVDAVGVNHFSLFGTPGDSSSGYYTTTGFLTGGTTNLPGVTGLPVGTFAGFASGNPAVANLSDFNRGSFASFPTSPNGSPDDELPIIAGNSYKITEKTTAFYTQGDVKGSVWGLDVSGNAGLRGLHVTEDADGFQSVGSALSNTGGQLISQTAESVSAHNSYWKLLPSANLLVHPIKPLNVRLAYAKTLTLPGYSSLRPNGAVVFKLPYNNIQEPNLFSGGNTFLEPTLADNYDLTGEYYTPGGGAIVLSLFRKEINGFVTNLTQLQVPIPGQTGLFDSTTSVNAGKGRTSGFEIGTNQPFTFLPSPFDGFGIAANYTYVDSNQTVETTNGPITSSLPGTSKTNVNSTVYYEKHGFGARIAFNHRTDYVVGVGNLSYNDTVINREFVKGYDTLDASLSQEIGSHFELILTGTNLSGANQIHYLGSAHLLAAVFPFPRVYTLSFRAKM